MLPSLSQSWLAAGIEAWTLTAEASAVIALRTVKLAMGRDWSGRETRLMVTEKLSAALELQTAMLTGTLSVDPAFATRQALNLYTRRARANRIRLS
ncbi:MAG TPA: hypothetical protein VM055_01390 [Novosphingobium sp.]|nr:hypothetical protein [Novosphingobium sp.]